MTRRPGWRRVGGDRPDRPRRTMASIDRSRNVATRVGNRGARRGEGAHLLPRLDRRARPTRSRRRGGRRVADAARCARSRGGGERTRSKKKRVEAKARGGCTGRDCGRHLFRPRVASVRTLVELAGPHCEKESPSRKVASPSPLPLPPPSPAPAAAPAPPSPPPPRSIPADPPPAASAASTLAASRSGVRRQRYRPPWPPLWRAPRPRRRADDPRRHRGGGAAAAPTEPRTPRRDAEAGGEARGRGAAAARREDAGRRREARPGPPHRRF